MSARWFCHVAAHLLHLLITLEFDQRKNNQRNFPNGRLFFFFFCLFVFLKIST